MKMRIENIAMLDQMEQTVRGNTESAIQHLLSQVATPSLDLMRKIKFERIGYDPLNGDKVNFIEQVNQTFTILTTCKAIRKLYELHGANHVFVIHEGTKSGTDIVSDCGLIAAEVFAAVSPGNNGKLNDDIKKVYEENPTATSRYVFFSAPGYEPGRQEKLEKHNMPVQVWAVEP